MSPRRTQERRLSNPLIARHNFHRGGGDQVALLARRTLFPPLPFRSSRSSWASRTACSRRSLRPGLSRKASEPLFSLWACYPWTSAGAGLRIEKNKRETNCRKYEHDERETDGKEPHAVLLHPICLYGDVTPAVMASDQTLKEPGNLANLRKWNPLVARVGTCDSPPGVSQQGGTACLPVSVDSRSPMR